MPYPKLPDSRFHLGRVNSTVSELPQFYRGRDFSFLPKKLICCVLIFIGLLTVFDLPAVVKLHKSFRIKRDYSFKLAAVIMHIFHLRSALPFAAICHERWVFFPGTTRRCQTTNTNDLTSGRLAVPSSLATTPQSSFLQATHRPVRDFDFFFERLIASSAASPPHYFPARLSSSCSSTSACGSSTSSTTGASHLQSVSSRRLSETPFSSTFHQSKSWLVVFMTSDRRDFLAHELSSLIIRHWTFWIFTHSSILVFIYVHVYVFVWIVLAFTGRYFHHYFIAMKNYNL